MQARGIRCDRQTLVRLVRAPLLRHSLGPALLLQISTGTGASRENVDGDLVNVGIPRSTDNGGREI